MTTNLLSSIVSVISLLVALSAVVIGTYINHKNSRRQTLVPLKRDQIVSLQKDISEFIAISSVELGTKASGERAERVEKLMTLASSIDFQLIIGSYERSKIVPLLKAIVTKYHESSDTIDERETLVAQSKLVLSSGWKELEKT